MSEVCPTCGSDNRKLRKRLPGDPLDFSRHDYWCEDDWHDNKMDKKAGHSLLVEAPPTEEVFDAWVYRLNSIARQPPSTGSYHQLSHIVRDIYEAGWKSCAAGVEAQPEAGFLSAQLAAVNAMLQSLPANDHLGRIGFESRRNELVEALGERKARGVEAKPASEPSELVEYLAARGTSDFIRSAMNHLKKADCARESISETLTILSKALEIRGEKL